MRISHRSRRNLRTLAAVVLLASIAGGIFNFLIQVNRLVGQNVLAHFIRGTYHTPKEEERLFMFLDIESSTEIAEKLGDARFHALLNRFFCDLTDAVLQTDGEIYEYVGDEIIVSWKNANGLQNANCLRCFFWFRERSKKTQKHIGGNPVWFPTFVLRFTGVMLLLANWVMSDEK